MSTTTDCSERASACHARLKAKFAHISGLLSLNNSVIRLRGNTQQISKTSEVGRRSKKLLKRMFCCIRIIKRSTKVTQHIEMMNTEMIDFVIATPKISLHHLVASCCLISTNSEYTIDGMSLVQARDRYRTIPMNVTSRS